MHRAILALLSAILVGCTLSLPDTWDADAPEEMPGTQPEASQGDCSILSLEERAKRGCPPSVVSEPAPAPKSAEASLMYDFSRQGSFLFYDIYFKSGSDALLPRSFPRLDEVARDLLRQPAVRVQVGVHSDTSGSGAYNLTLSQKRAAAIFAYLVKAGVSPSNLEAKGFGETTPIAPNDTPINREKNRRVELRKVEMP